MADNTKQTYTLAFKVDVGNAKQNLHFLQQHYQVFVILTCLKAAQD